MSDSNNSAGTWFLPLLGLMFICLKLCHVINWSWWLVAMPIWIEAISVIVIIVGALIWYHIREPF